MSIQVPSETLDKTNKCSRALACLDESNCREVQDRSGAQDILCTRTKPPPDCSYGLSFAYSYVCRCPAHYSLYTRGLW